MGRAGAPPWVSNTAVSRPGVITTLAATPWPGAVTIAVRAQPSTT